MNDREVLEALYATVENRRDNPKEGSYTCYLLDKGIDRSGDHSDVHARQGGGLSAVSLCLDRTALRR